MAAEWQRKKCQIPKTGRRGRRPLRPRDLGVQAGTRVRHIMCPLRIPFAASGRTLQLTTSLIRFFCQLEQYPHQFRVIQWLLAAEESVLDKTIHRRLGSAKFC